MQVPAPFEYARATSVEEALSLLGQHGPDARLIAGGHSLLPMMKLRLASPEFLVDINELKELDYIELDGDTLRIGALTRHRELYESELLDEHFPIFHDAERVIADPIVRNRGTIGGALCQADPSEDLSAVCAAVGAELVIRGADGERTVAARDFHRGPYETAVGDGEMLTEVRIAMRPNAGSAYEKVERRAGDWAVAAAGAAVWMDGDAIGDAGIGLAAVGADAFGAPAVADFLRGKTPSEDVFEAAGDVAAEHCSPTADQRGSVEYKRHLAAELTKRALRTASARAMKGV